MSSEKKCLLILWIEFYETHCSMLMLTAFNKAMQNNSAAFQDSLAQDHLGQGMEQEKLGI